MIHQKPTDNTKKQPAMQNCATTCRISNLRPLMKVLYNLNNNAFYCPFSYERNRWLVQRKFRYVQKVMYVLLNTLFG
jgi:hypothetical protein